MIVTHIRYYADDFDYQSKKVKGSPFFKSLDFTVTSSWITKNKDITSLLYGKYPCRFANLCANMTSVFGGGMFHFDNFTHFITCPALCRRRSNERKVWGAFKKQSILNNNKKNNIKTHKTHISCFLIRNINYTKTMKFDF